MEPAELDPSQSRIQHVREGKKICSRGTERPGGVLKANNEEDGAASVEDLARDESRNMGAGRGPPEHKKVI